MSNTTENLEKITEKAVDQIMNGVTNELLSALAKAQAEFPTIEKNRVAKVPTKAGSSYSYRYADLADILKAVRPILSKYELAISQETDGSELWSYLFHSRGGCLTSRVPLVVAQGTGPQAMGSSLTYSRRYGLTLLLGIVAEEDDDAQAAQGAHKPVAPLSSRQPEPKRKLTANEDFPKTNPGWEKELATEPQRKRMWAMAKEVGFDAAHLQDMISTAFHKESSKELTKGEIQKIFSEFEMMISKK